MSNSSIHTNCCICGGGPAGIMLGFLLARAGIEVVVLEKHADFFRDFRGDTIHPSTLLLMHELGILDDFLQVPHQELQTLSAVFNGTEIQIANFTHLPEPAQRLALMPQWDFLNFIAGKAVQYKNFTLLKETKVFELLRDEKRITGVKADTPKGMIEITAQLVVGADGRSSDVRRLAGLEVINTGAPIDVLWFRLSKVSTNPQQTLGRIQNGKLMVLLNRDTYWQCAFVIMKGDLENIKPKGLDGFYDEIISISPFLKDRVHEIKSWDDVKLLSVSIDHLQTWYTHGLLCIGDASHAMSPVGGVGINLAIQDAVAAANILYPALLQNKPIQNAVLAIVQQRREFPARMIQRLQVMIQKGIVGIRNDVNKQKKLPLLFKILRAFPFLTRFPAKIIGMGVRPEHIRTPERKSLESGVWSLKSGVWN